ncbi:unnamed protein product, partial [Brassica rapa]
PDPEKDSAAVQDFFSKMEAAFMAHPLWSGCSEDELDSTGDGLEKYVMTKLFSRVFASNTEGMLYLMRNSFRRCLWFNSSFLLNIFKSKFILICLHIIIISRGTKKTYQKNPNQKPSRS